MRRAAELEQEFWTRMAHVIRWARSLFTGHGCLCLGCVQWYGSKSWLRAPLCASGMDKLAAGTLCASGRNRCTMLSRKQNGHRAECQQWHGQQQVLAARCCTFECMHAHAQAHTYKHTGAHALISCAHGSASIACAGVSCLRSNLSKGPGLKLCRLQPSTELLASHDIWQSGYSIQESRGLRHLDQKCTLTSKLLCLDLGAFSDKGTRVWRALEKQLERYHGLLQTRANNLADVNSLQHQNNELRALLNQYLGSRINEELEIPPTQII